MKKICNVLVLQNEISSRWWWWEVSHVNFMLMNPHSFEFCSVISSWSEEVSSTLVLIFSSNSLCHASAPLCIDFIHFFSFLAYSITLPWLEMISLIQKIESCILGPSNTTYCLSSIIILHGCNLLSWKTYLLYL